MARKAGKKAGKKSKERGAKKPRKNAPAKRVGGASGKGSRWRGLVEEAEEPKKDKDGDRNSEQPEN